MVKKWIGKELKYDDAIFTIGGYDTIDYSFDAYEYKVLAYVDSEGCTDCKMKLEEWKGYIANVETLFPGKVGFVFCFATKSVRTVRYLLSKHDFRYPVYIDTTNNFVQTNKISCKYIPQAFLLGRDNVIIAIGNPITNYKIGNLYNRIFNMSNLSGHDVP